ncbi:uncharacterized protein LOC125495604 [Beta vulgaris subsp. vulgaris]|uniref:uncharacterized protein LOC125495604 n=1 Tax=Beta vulgaris subsp. vulgaris TaxID=3555 RepID=UPI002036835B|nr:uncharacterized protein LOC125495604 [Beta vulgaris subsp. vulgaris]
MPMPGYRFVLPGLEDTILSAPSGQLAVYRLALDAGLRFPLHPFISRLLHYYNIGHNQLSPNSWQNILTFLAVCELKGVDPSLAAFSQIHCISKVPRTMDGAWFSVCNRQGFLTSWDKTSKMHAWKAEFLFVQAPNEVVARWLRYFSRATTNTGRTTSYLELESTSAEEMEYFRISEYSINNTSFKGPSNWIPFKEMFYSDNFLVAAGLRRAEYRDSARAKLKKSWTGDMSSSKFADSLWKEYSKTGSKKRTDTLKNAPTSRALAEKAASKKRPATTGEAPPKKSKGFTAKKKKSSRPALPKVEIPPKAEEVLPSSEERALVSYAGPVDSTLPLASSQPDAVVTLDGTEEAKKSSTQPDAALDRTTFSGPVAKLVSQMPAAYRSASRFFGESNYSNRVRTLRVSGRPMSSSNKQAVVIPVRNIDEFPLSDKGKGVAEAAPDGSPTLSDDESSAAFARMTSADREKLKQELVKCFPEPYIKGLRGVSSGHVGYMSQLAVELFARSMITEDWARLLMKENK